MNAMVVPRAALLITHLKGLEGDLELVPKQSEWEELSRRLCVCSSSYNKYQNLW